MRSPNPRDPAGLCGEEIGEDTMEAIGTAFLLIAAFAVGFFVTIGAVFGQIAAKKWLGLSKDRSDTP